VVLRISESYQLPTEKNSLKSIGNSINIKIYKEKSIKQSEEKSAGSGVGMNGYAILFHKTCVHPCNTIHIHNALRYWRLPEYNVFGTGMGRVIMSSKITPFFQSSFPADFSWRADSS
jgi:hypothetical protein